MFQTVHGRASSNSFSISADSRGSRLPVGSSARRMSGRFTTARAISIRCCSPADKAAGFSFSLFSKPT